MRTLLTRSGLFLAVAVTCISLTGCAGGLFDETVTWKGGGSIFVNDRKLPEDVPATPMQLTLRPDGTGHATDIPQGKPKFDDNICIESTGNRLYTGEITWRNSNNVSFEISFADSTYTIRSGPEKGHIDWSEIRIYTCNPGPEYWRLDATKDIELRPML